MAIQVKQLWRHTVKSCRGERIAQTVIDEAGFDDDRRFAVVNERGVLQTQRNQPKLALIGVRLCGKYYPEPYLELSADGHKPILVQNMAEEAEDDQRRPLGIFKDQSEGFDCEDEVAQWLTNVLGEPCRLLQWTDIGLRKSPRPHSDIRAGVAYQDAYPALVISEESLAAFNAFLATQQPAARAKTVSHFRPNLIVAGVPAFDEDRWKEIVITGPNHPPTHLQGVKLCDRCVIPDHDPVTGEDEGTNTRELLKKMGRNLPMYPDGTNSETGPCFGMNLVWVHSQWGGFIEEGDIVTVKSRWS